MIFLQLIYFVIILNNILLKMPIALVIQNITVNGHEVHPINFNPFPLNQPDIIGIGIINNINLTAIVVLIVLIFVFGAIYRIHLKQLKKANTALQRKVEEQALTLTQQDNSLQELSEKLQEKDSSDQSKLMFFNDMLDEFRTPLTIILGHTQNLTKDSKLSLNLIKKNASLLMQLINHVSDIQKSDQKPLKLSVSFIELIGFVQSVINSFKGMSEQKNIQLILDTFSSEIYVWLDAEKLKLVFYNLFFRIIKSSNQGKSILVSLQQRESVVQIKVTVQELGFPDDEREKFFNSSSLSKRDKKTTRKFDLGLPLVKNLVELQKGKIELEKKEGEAYCFILTFQLGKDHFSAEEIKNSENNFITDQIKPEQLPTFMNDIGDQKILIVEENPDMIDFLVQLLEKNFALKAANNGQEALEMITDFMPDLIITDNMMPSMNGIDFCKQVKNNIQTSHIPLILLSAKTDIKTHVDSLETGADAYIEKPFYSPLLLANIHSLLKNREYIKAQFNVSDLKFSLPNQLSKQDRNFIKIVNEIIESKLADPLFNVEELSKKANMSRATFYRKFTGLIGINPADYIRKNRLKKAYALIKDKQLNISRVAEYTGFLSVSQFRKSFKKEFGKTPSEIQKK